MSPVRSPDPTPPDARGALLPLLARTDLASAMARHPGRSVSVTEFLTDVARVAAQLPPGAAALNLADDRYAFTVLFAALLSRGQINVLPSSRSPEAVALAARDVPGRRVLDGSCVTAAAGLPAVPEWPALPQVLAQTTALVAYTSGSSGQPQAHPRTWEAACAAHAGTRQRLQTWFGPRFSVVATVPPQHMYGWEFTVLLPLQAEVAVHAGRPLFPADIAAALAEMPAPSVLVTTPLHLRTLLDADIALPPLAGVLSATAPLDAALAARAEAKLATRVYEIFGSTETCAIASRRTVAGPWWQPMPGVELQPQREGCLVIRPGCSPPLWLGDQIEREAGSDRFRLIGRQHDLLEIAGKRMSLAALNRHLLDLPGVEDGVVFQQDPGPNGVGRIAALVVAPALDEAVILARLRQWVDPVFLPRPLRRVEILPRNETGKLPRQALLAMLSRPAIYSACSGQEAADG